MPEQTIQGSGPPVDSDLGRRLAGLTPAQRVLLEKMLAQSGIDLGIRRRPDDVDVPASYEQERLWFMAQLVAHPEIFYVPIALWLRGGLDVEALRSALARLVDRHEALRTVFRDTDAGLRQCVLDRLDVPLEVHSCLDAPDPGAEARRLGSASVMEPFDLSAGPLVRCRLYQTAPDEHMFVFTEHHIISDYWSLGVILADLGALYAEQVGAGPGPQPIDVHYADFAYWQRVTMDEKLVAQQLTYWRERLADLPESLDLPTDRPRPAIRGSQGRFHPVQFGADVVGPLRELARSQSATLLGGFLAGYIALLSRLVHRNDIVVGVPVAGRPRPEMQSMVGYFLNWLPIRVDVQDHTSLRDLVRSTAAALAGAMANQELPFDVLVRELPAARRPGITPVFQTSFSLRDSAPQPPSMPGVEVSFADIDGSATHFDLMAELWQEGDRVVGYLPYDEELFDESTVAAFAGWLERLLAAGLAAPDQPVSTLPLFADTEQARLHGAAAAAPSSTAFPTLHAHFAITAAHRPNATAVCDEDTQLTYAQLDQRANRIANVLLARGVRPGDVVGLVLGRTVDLVAAVLGVLRCGAAYLPVDPDGPPGRAATQFADCAVTTVLVSPDITDRLPAGRPSPAVLAWDEGEFAGAAQTPVAVDVPTDSPAYVIYTSGSTGVPKGVLVSHANVLRLFETCRTRFDIGESDTWTLFHSFAFDFSVWELWGALLHGGRLVVVPQWITRAPDVLADLLERERVTVLSATPSAFAQLSRHVLTRGPAGLRLRYVVFGGEALNHSALGDWFATFGDEQPRLINMYGITETTVHVTFRRVTRADVGRAESLIGVPLDDLCVYLLDGNLQPVPVGVPGEMYIGGRGVTLGYQGDPRLTAQRMLPDPWSAVRGMRMYRSGDVAVLRRDGELAYLGRRDDQHKIRGHRIELGEVRAALDRLPEIAHAAVVVAKDRVGAPSLVGYVVPAAGQQLSGAQVRRALLPNLPDWMVPSTVKVVPDIPLTKNGKLDQAALAGRRLESTGSRDVSGPAPQGRTATTLATIWTELLGGTNLTADDHFFDLGGHSLMVVQLVAQIRGSFGVDLPMAVLFERPQLQAMADTIDELVASHDEPVPARTGGPTNPATEPELSPDAPIEAVRADIDRRLHTLHRARGPRPTPLAPGPDAAGSVLLTGATGFVGAFVLAGLVERGPAVVCLLRGGARRRDDLLLQARRLGLGGPVADGLASGRIELLDADISAARLGLSTADHQALADRVDAVIHTAAWVNHVYPYAQLAAANAHSAGALLELAGVGRRKNIVYVSASAVVESGAYQPGERIDAAPLRALPTGPSGYARSKAVAEEYFRHAAEFDVAAVVVRIPSIFGDRTRFQINHGDALWSWCQAMLATGGYPSGFDLPGNELFQALPADITARILIDQMLAPQQPGCQFVNAIPEAVCGTTELITAARACGNPLQPVPDAEWYEQVGRLDAGKIWVAGIAAGIARSSTGNTPRRLRRFIPGGGPQLTELLAAHAIRTPQEIARYFATLMQSDRH
jgi:amino acid adenylation domain-containing protein/thioester reductase-like protein